MNDDRPTEIDLSKAYTKTFKMQATGADGKTTRVSVPRDVVKKEARRLQLTVPEFLAKYRIEWKYNSFPGIYATFILTPRKE